MFVCATCEQMVSAHHPGAATRRVSGIPEPTWCRLGPGGFPLQAAGWRVEGGKPAAACCRRGSACADEPDSPPGKPRCIQPVSPGSEATTREPGWCGTCLEDGLRTIKDVPRGAVPCPAEGTEADARDDHTGAFDSESRNACVGMVTRGASRARGARQHSSG